VHDRAGARDLVESLLRIVDIGQHCTRRHQIHACIIDGFQCRQRLAHEGPTILVGSLTEPDGRLEHALHIGLGSRDVRLRKGIEKMRHHQSFAGTDVEDILHAVSLHSGQHLFGLSVIGNERRRIHARTSVSCDHHRRPSNDAGAHDRTPLIS